MFFIGSRCLSGTTTKLSISGIAVRKIGSSGAMCLVLRRKFFLPSLELGPSLQFYSRQRQVFIELSPFVRWQWLAATGPSDHLEAAVALDYISASNGSALQFGARLSLGLGL
jgi:hypothetical protein